MTIIRFICVLPLAGLVMLHAGPVDAAAKVIAGAPQVIEGDLLKVGGEVVRLYGIDAPERSQMCQGASRQYRCGRIATTGLMDLTAGVVRVTCEKKEVDRDGVMVARCLDTQGFDLSRQMLYTGWALALPSASAGFHLLEAKSRKAKRGLWKGAVIAPWEWRKARKASTK